MAAILIAAILIILDQVSKLVIQGMFNVGEKLEILPGIINFTYVQNRGAAFGMFSSHRWFFMALSILVIILILVYLLKFKTTHFLGTLSLGLILGGGVGNMIDRIRLGYVIDFIDFCAFDFWKWVFNIADCGVTVGCALFFVYLLFFDTENNKKSAQKEKDNYDR